MALICSAWQQAPRDHLSTWTIWSLTFLYCCPTQHSAPLFHSFTHVFYNLYCFLRAVPNNWEMCWTNVGEAIYLLAAPPTCILFCCCGCHHDAIPQCKAKGRWHNGVREALPGCLCALYCCAIMQNSFYVAFWLWCRFLGFHPFIRLHVEQKAVLSLNADKIFECKGHFCP